MINSIYLVNVVTWLAIFSIVAIIVQKKLGVLGFTIGVGGALMTLFSAIQDAYNLGPTFLTVFPFNSFETTPFYISPAITTAAFAVVSFTVTFLMERAFYKPARTV
ncbi:MAG: hypothetical protein RXR31_08545 [Thermoproteota archaeon]|jgi:hypothetical protein